MKIYSICILLACSISSVAQVTKYRHIAGVEIATVGYLMPAGAFINYDYLFKHSEQGFWSARAAVGGFYGSSWHAGSVRTSLGYNLGKKANYLQFGIGGSYVNEYYRYRESGPDRQNHYYIGPQVGYRRVGPKRLDFGVYLGLYTGTDTYLGGGISFGWAFGKRNIGTQ